MTTATTLVRSAELVKTETASEIYGRHQVPGTQPLFRHDIRVYRLTYSTRDVDGTEVVASGAVLIPDKTGPIPTMAYLRGTILPVHWERRVPSYYDLENNQSIYENYEMSYLAAGFASAGYLTIAPDLIGYGASKDREHPYMHAASLAWVARDMLRPCRDLANEQGISLERDLFITGWSEGGLAGMALHELLERENSEELPVRGSSLLAGCYALSEMLEWFCCLDEPYPEQEIYYWALRSMNRVHALGLPFEHLVRPEYAARLSEDVMAPVPANPRDGLAHDFRSGMQHRTEDAIRRAFSDSDRYDWCPRAHVFLHHGTHDDIVPFFTAQLAYQAMRARGGSATLYPYLGQDHYQPVNAYVVRTLADFARCRETGKV